MRETQFGLAPRWKRNNLNFDWQVCRECFVGNADKNFSMFYFLGKMSFSTKKSQKIYKSLEHTMAKVKKENINIDQRMARDTERMNLVMREVKGRSPEMFLGASASASASACAAICQRPKTEAAKRTVKFQQFTTTNFKMCEGTFVRNIDTRRGIRSNKSNNANSTVNLSCIGAGEKLETSQNNVDGKVTAQSLQTLCFI